jgi:hypothetical protein
VQPGKGLPGSSVVAELDRSRIRPFRLLAVTWDQTSAELEVAVEVRVRADGTWSGWQDLAYEPHEGPAPGEEGSARAGTSPLWVGSADGVAARVMSADGSAPAGVRVVAIDPGKSPYDAALAHIDQDLAPSERITPARAEAIRAADGTLTTMPYIFSRRQWGADRSLTSDCDPPGETVKVVFVHHTAGSNKYPERDSAAIVRSIYAYHTQGRGWCDVGYNFLVDRHGNVFEGRRGGVRKPVHGAHVGDVNHNSVGIGLMGDFSTIRPTEAMRDKLVRLIAWRMGSSYKPARGTGRIYGHSFRRISGHRDAMSTSCPGQVVYEWLPRLRIRVADYMGDFRTPIYWKWKAQGGYHSELRAPFMAEHWQNGGRYTVFGGGRIYWSKDSGAHVLTGPVLRKFRKYGGVGSRLRWPVTDVWHVQEVGAVRASFLGGRVYWSRRTGGRVMYGPILDRYVREGAAEGRLGLPDSRVFRVPVGKRQRFEHGAVTFDRKRDRTFVSYHP